MFGSILGMLVIGAIAGWLAGKIVKGRGFGVLGNIVVGVVGALIAGFLLPRIGFGMGDSPLVTIIQSAFGAVVLLVLIQLVKRT